MKAKEKRARAMKRRQSKSEGERRQSYKRERQREDGRSLQTTQLSAIQQSDEVKAVLQVGRHHRGAGGGGLQGRMLWGIFGWEVEVSISWWRGCAGV